MAIYEYMTLSDETMVLHSQILDGNRIHVTFERPTESGFDTARAELPSYTWLENRGFSEKEIGRFNRLMRRNAHLFYKYAADGGLKLA